MYEIIEYQLVANVENNSPNLSVLYDGDSLDHAREIKTLLGDLKHGHTDYMKDETKKEIMDTLKLLEHEFGVSILDEALEIVEAEYIPEVSQIKIYEVKEVKEEDTQTCSNCEKVFNIFDEGSSDNPDLCDSCYNEVDKATTHNILSYDSNEIHNACSSLGHSNNWESFEKELETYSLQDKKNLSRVLEDE